MSLALVMSAILWFTRWSDSLLGLIVFFVLSAAVLSTSAYVRSGRRGLAPTQLPRRGTF